MKPKKRESQKQTSRMYLRHHDHRDAIFDKTYHNAIYVKKTARLDEKGHIKEPAIDDYVWFKFPKNALLTTHGGYSYPVQSAYPTDSRMFSSKATSASLSGDNRIIRWMDVDRQFQYSNLQQEFLQNQNINAQITALYGYGRALKFSDFVLVITTLNNAGSRPTSLSGFVTKDGVRWKPFAFGGNETMITATSFYFGNDCICDIYYDAGRYPDYHETKELVIYKITCTDELQVSITELRRLNIAGYFDNYYDTFLYLCNTPTGAVFRTIDVWEMRINEKYYHVNENGEITLYYYSYEMPAGFDEIVSPSPHVYGAAWDKRQAPFDFVRQGNTCIAIVAEVMYLNEDTVPAIPTYDRVLNFTLHFSRNGLDWEASVLYSCNLGRGRKDAFTYTDTNVHVYFSYGKFYCLIGSPYIREAEKIDVESLYGYETKMFYSYNGEVWIEKALEKWWDIPISGEGNNIATAVDEGQKLRIAIRPAETPDYDCIMLHMFGDHSIMFRDGEINNLNDIDYLYLSGGNFERKTYGAYINMQEHSKDFAWENGADSMFPIAEKVEAYDYCAPAGGFDDEDPDPDKAYVYYVWNFDTEEFDVVDRHLSTYAHYTIVYVDELPAVGVANTLYGVLTDLNQEPLYEYFIWMNGDYSRITEFTAYANYQLLKVSQLPVTGVEFIIYAVPMNLDSFDTYMYIWNPNVIYEETHGAFEDINTTSYDMSGRKWTTINVKTLPDTGRVGIIYISEEKYEPVRKAHEDNTYNYYQWDNSTLNYILVNPITDVTKYKILDVLELIPPAPGVDTTWLIWRIPKELDGHSYHDLWPSENDLLEYLRGRTDRHDQWLNSSNELPLVGVSKIFYIVRETPGQYTGFYTVYMWDASQIRFRKTNEYEYFISPDPDDPKETRFIEIIEHIIGGDE